MSLEVGHLLDRIRAGVDPHPVDPLADCGGHENVVVDDRQATR
jgi:hypothetical protein